MGSAIVPSTVLLAVSTICTPPDWGNTSAELMLVLRVTSVVVALPGGRVGGTVSATGAERTEYQLASPISVAEIWCVPESSAAVVSAALPETRSAAPMSVPLSKNWTGPAGLATPAGAAGPTVAVSDTSEPYVTGGAAELMATVGVTRSTAWP